MAPAWGAAALPRPRVSVAALVAAVPQAGPRRRLAQLSAALARPPAGPGAAAEIASAAAADGPRPVDKAGADDKAAADHRHHHHHHHHQSADAAAALAALRADLVAASSQQQQNASGAALRAALEALLVAALAHGDPAVRDEAVVLLNVLYDGHTLQIQDALPVSIATVGDAPVVRIPFHVDEHEFLLQQQEQLQQPQQPQQPQQQRQALQQCRFPRGTLAVRTYVWEAGGAGGAGVGIAAASGVREKTLPASAVAFDGKAGPAAATTFTIRFPPFQQVGYCDWVLTSSDDADSRLLELRRVAGRFIVHRADARSQLIYEVPVDEVGATWDEHTGRLRSRGTFGAVMAALPDLKMAGATAVYLMGALDRPREDDMAISPFVVARRDAPAAVLGGPASFRALAREIASMGMVPIVDAIDRVSKTRGHRQYDSMRVSTLSPAGILTPHPGTDGRENQWDETLLLNYRDINAWTSFIDDIRAFALSYGVGGVRLDNAQSTPLTLEVDEGEMFRLDVDGEFHYSEAERLLGSVVVPNREQGYWTSEAAIFRGYPNPFMVKVCKELWSEYPDFVIVAESHFHREAQLAASGCIPHSIRVPQILASINGKSLRRDGTLLRRLPNNRRSTAATLSRLYKSDRISLPKNAILLNCSCSHLSPYPALLFGRRSWLAVDFLFFLPHIPMLLIGEDAGRAYRHNMAPVLENAESSEYDVNYDAVLPKSPKRKAHGLSPSNSSNVLVQSANPLGSFTLSTSARPLPTINVTAGPPKYGGQDSNYMSSGENPVLSLLAAVGINGSVDTLAKLSIPNDHTSDIQGTPAVNTGPNEVVNGLAFEHESLASILNGPTVSASLGDKAFLDAAPGRRGYGLARANANGSGDARQLGLGSAGNTQALPTGRGRAAGIGLPRRGSMSSLGLKLQSPKPSQKGLLRTMSKDDMVGLSIRNMSSEELRKMSALEDAARAEIGPETGYDLAQIRAHYSHRCLLRQEHEVLRHGHFCILSPDPQCRDSVFSFARFTEEDIVIVAANIRDTRDGTQFSNGVFVDLDLRVLWEDDIGLPSAFSERYDHLFKFVNLFTNQDFFPGEMFTLEEVVFRKCSIHIPPLGIVVLKLVPVASPIDNSPEAFLLYDEHFAKCLTRLQESDASNSIKDARENHVIACIGRGAASSLESFANAVEKARAGLVAEGCDGDTVQNVLQLCLQRASALLPSVLYEHASAPKDFTAPTGERINAYLSLLSTVSSSPELLTTTRILVKKSAKIGPIVFLSAELGRFSTAGGLGVMVDELTKGLVVLGLEVYVVSPYYAVNRKNEPDYLGQNVAWTRNLLINIGTGLVEVGVFEGVEEGVNLIFLERKDYFTKVYANPGSSIRHLQCIVLMSLGSLEIFCQKAVKPSVVVTNDWLPSMAAGYARNGHFGDFFNDTSFMHLIHNLGDTTYEGRCFPEVEGDDMGYVHRLPRHLVVDPLWSRTICNPSRTALLCSDSWGTVSPSYMKELLSGHDLSPLLQLARRPFAYPNGIPKAARELLLLTKGAPDHPTAKALLQSRYFAMERPDPSVPLFAFVGRVTAQKGVHLILNAVEALIRHTDGKVQILVGGPANYQDPYAAGCAHHMHALRYAHPTCFWAAPDEFFTDGPLVNLGADFGVMPSLFEPGGIVQQEFFVAGTPVVAFKTGGLKDTVHEWQVDESEGNGFLFEEYNHDDFVMAMKRALRVFSTPAEYMALRRSAYITTIDVSQVAWAWSSEFHRMRNAIYSREDVLHAEYSSRMRIEVSKAVGSGALDMSARVVDLCWSTAIKGEESVYVKGSWDDWAAEYKLKPVAAGRAVYATQVLLPRGEYTYKFRVGQTWLHASDRPMRNADLTGETMNVLVVQ